MIRAIAFSVLATGAPHAPITVILQSVDGSSVTCPAQSQTFDLVIGRSTLTVIGLACVSDSIFRNSFEVSR